MISLQHASFSSVLACAAATTLPPSPAESAGSPSTCDSPSTHYHPNNPADVDPPGQSVMPLASDEGGTRAERSVPECHTASPSSDPPVTDSDRAPQKPSARVEESTIEHAAKLDPQDEVSAKQSEVPDSPRTSFVQFARQLQLEKHQQARKNIHLHRLREVRNCLGISKRLLRVGSTVQNGLVESFKQGDKSGFVCTYNAVCDMHDVCDAAFRRSLHGHDPLVTSPLGSEQDRYPSFIQRLTNRSREDLLEILTLARTDSQFLFRSLCQLIPSHLSSLVSPVHTPAMDDSEYGVPPRGRTQPLFSKRATPQSATFKEHVFALERTDALSTLVYNTFAHPLDFDTPESRLRLDVWASTCAKLISYGGSGHYFFVGHLLSCWADGREWKAKSKFETYLMNVLQEGAFLLEQHDLRHLGLDGQFLDPLQTDVAENFFQSAVTALFEVLDDADGGLPAGALEFGNAILDNLDAAQTRKRFSDYLFFQWYFCKFLHNALSYPESLGLLLDFHVSKEAREKLLGQIALRAQAQVSRVLQSLPYYSPAHPDIKSHIETMLSHIGNVSPHREASGVPTSREANKKPEMTVNESHLLLSAADIAAILDILFPKPTSSTFGATQSYQHKPSASSPTSCYSQRLEPPSRSFQPGIFQGKIDTLSNGSRSSKPVFTTEMSFLDAMGSHTTSPSDSMSPVSPESALTRNAERIRFEIAEIGKSDDRPTLEHPTNESWVTFYVSANENTLSYESPGCDVSENSREPFYDGFQSEDDGSGSIREAILKLVDESGTGPECDSSFHLAPPVSLAESAGDGPSLATRFSNAMEDCERRYDFIDAHYWWNASRLLGDRYRGKSAVDAESETLAPMMLSATKATERSTSIIRHCEKQFIDLKRAAEHFQGTINKMMTTLQKLRNKMWFMTDVKNSLRYEDAKNVALALKKMGVPQTAPSDPDSKPKQGQRNLGGSFLQKPEIQVLNVMRAPGNQGGPSKLSDEQVEVTRKWLDRFGVDNFCKGEERIHRFCYEVKTSVNKLVGESMYDSPVLWSSELFQKERSLYESPGIRPATGVSVGNNVRPSSIASEDSLYHPSQPLGQKATDSLFRSVNEVHSLGRKSSYQSLGSDRWKPGRDISGADTSSIGDSPGRTVSTSTGGDLLQPFWSPPQTQPQSMTSASSLNSRPPSMFGEIMVPKRSDRKAHRKAVFLDELKRTMTSLLLSDLGSPVWSCGSETDAWFSAYLNQECIKEQTRKRAKMQKVFADLDAQARNDHKSRTSSYQLRRSRSVDLGVIGAETPAAAHGTGREPEPEGFFGHEEREQSGFAYSAAFRDLMDKFSRPANPFVKLKALQDMRSLVLVSLAARNTRSLSPNDDVPGGTGPGRQQRNSVSEVSKLPKLPDLSTPTPHTPVSDSVSMNTEPSPSSTPSEDQIIRALRDLIQTLQPKTLFRDLQFIAAFVPSETLNRTDSGSAFLHFGLAAFSLKDEICNSIVEIADNIVSQELNQRQRRPTAPNLTSLVGNGIRDAAQMWIIPAREGNAVAQRELAILYLTHPDLVRCATLPLTMPRDTFKTEMMYRRDGDSKSDPQSMCLALHWMKLAAAGGDKLAQNRLREREEFDSIA